MRFDLGEDLRRLGRGRSFRFGPDGFVFDFDIGGPGRHKKHGRRNRMFEGGQLKLVLLKLVADEPRHGYELIRAIEDMTDGAYAPSPGIVYPTLTLLEDMGLIAPKKSDDTRKTYKITKDGKAHLGDHEDEVERLFSRLEDRGEKRRRGQRPEMKRAMANLMMALRNRVVEEGWDERLIDEVTEILDDAARRIEKLK